MPTLVHCVRLHRRGLSTRNDTRHWTLLRIVKGSALVAVIFQSCYREVHAVSENMFGASKVIKYTNSDTFLIDLDLDEPIKCFSCSKYRKARRKDRDNPAALEQEHKLYLEEAVLERKIPETDLRQLVELPPGLGYEEWLASHTIDFFQHINLLYGTVCEYCTLSGCPDMTGPTTRQYLWFDEKGKKTRVAAPQYVDYVMTFTQKTINDESIFPTKFENDFPVSFESIVKKIQRLLFHVVAHIYHSHFREMVLLNLHAHLNCIFAHFILFNERFGLIDEKETEILHDLVVALKLHPESEQSDATTTATTTITTTTSSTTSCSQIVGLDCSGSPAASSGDTSTAINTLSSEREGGTCPSSEDQESSSVTDTAAVTMDSSSGVMASTEDSSAGATAPLLPDTGAVPDTRP